MSACSRRRRRQPVRRIGAFGLFTGQIGYACNNALFYVKGGAAVTDVASAILATATNVSLPTPLNDTRWGGTVGVGLEFGFSPNWSAAVEYDHLFMGTAPTISPSWLIGPA